MGMLILATPVTALDIRLGIGKIYMQSFWNNFNIALMSEKHSNEKILICHPLSFQRLFIKSRSPVKTKQTIFPWFGNFGIVFMAVYMAFIAEDITRLHQENVFHFH